MAYIFNLAESAMRHFRDGESLLDKKSAQHAGYHFGFAAECAIKSALYGYGYRPVEPRGTDPYWAHFPRLRTLVLQGAKGRLPNKLYDLISHGSFMQDWDTDIRYAKNQSVLEARAIQWRDQAHLVFGIVFF